MNTQIRVSTLAVASLLCLCSRAYAGTAATAPRIPTAYNSSLKLDVNEADNNGDTPLMRFVSLNDFDSVKLLIAAGANVNAKNKLGLTPLLLASSSRCVDALIAAGADVNKANNDGDTPLMRFVSINDYDIVKLLISAGANVNAKSKLGLTPLLLASSSRYVDSLIKAGADVNKAGNDGDTPLMRFVSIHDLDSVKALIAAGADVNAKSRSGITPISLASGSEFVDALTAAR